MLYASVNLPNDAAPTMFSAASALTEHWASVSLPFLGDGEAEDRSEGLPTVGPCARAPFSIAGSAANLAPSVSPDSCRLGVTAALETAHPMPAGDLRASRGSALPSGSGRPSKKCC